MKEWHLAQNVTELSSLPKITEKEYRKVQPKFFVIADNTMFKKTMNNFLLNDFQWSLSKMKLFTSQVSKKSILYEVWFGQIYMK